MIFKLDCWMLYCFYLPSFVRGVEHILFTVFTLRPNIRKKSFSSEKPNYNFGIRNFMDARDGKLNQHTYVADCRARNKVEWCISGRDPFVVPIRKNFYFASFIKSQKRNRRRSPNKKN